MVNVLQWLSVIGLCALRTVPGLTLAAVYKLTGIEIFITLLIGGMTGVVIFTEFGMRLRNFRKTRRRRLGHKKPLKLRRALRMKRLWKKFGIIGLAFLTPPLISPPVGALVAVYFRERTKRIYLFMFLSIVLWSFVFALIGHQVLDWTSI